MRAMSSLVVTPGTWGGDRRGVVAEVAHPKSRRRATRPGEHPGIGLGAHEGLKMCLYVAHDLGRDGDLSLAGFGLGGTEDPFAGDLWGVLVDDY